MFKSRSPTDSNNNKYSCATWAYELVANGEKKSDTTKKHWNK